MINYEKQLRKQQESEERRTRYLQIVARTGLDTNRISEKAGVSLVGLRGAATGAYNFPIRMIEKIEAAFQEVK